MITYRANWPLYRDAVAPALPIRQTLHGGLVNLLYDDGEPETRVPLSLVRHRGAQLSGSSDSDANSDSDGSEKGIVRLYQHPFLRLGLSLLLLHISRDVDITAQTLIGCVWLCSTWL